MKMKLKIENESYEVELGDLEFFSCAGNSQW